MQQGQRPQRGVPFPLLSCLKPQTYRATSPGGPYVKLNSSLITGLSFADTGLADGGTYYYVVTAVDGNGLEGARSAALGETAGSDTIRAGKSGGGGGGGCFVATAADRLLDGECAARLAAVILAASLFLLFAALCTGRRNITRPLARMRGRARARREHRDRGALA